MEGVTDGSALPVAELADFVIVGSGAAGATCARWLAAAGHEVVVLEEGPPARPAPGDALEALETLYRDGGATAALGPDTLPILQGRCVGGTTVVNGGIQVPFPEEVWREWVAADSRWGRLLPWDALERARATMDRELDVAPTPADLWGGNGDAMRRGLEGRAEPTRRNVAGCRGSGRCLQGCPHGAKRSADVSLLPRAAEQGARVYARCAAEWVRFRSGRAREVTGRFAGGAPMVARARKAVILAAGAIQTSWLLARSGVPGAGRNFQCHPGAAMAGLFPSSLLAGPEATQAMESLAWRHLGIKFETLGMPRAFRQARIPGAGPILAERLGLLDRVALWGVCVRAEARGTVHRGPWGPVVRYALTARDRALALQGLALLAEAMLRAGAVEVWPAVHGAPEMITEPARARALADLPPLPGAVPLVATHLFGGARVGDHFQVPGAEGLVVADSALFPSNLGVNPMSAITAVATLVAEAWA